MRILIIEDEREVANVLADALRADGHTPRVARSGPQALRDIAAEPPDAVFLDVRLPGQSGIDVLREIRRLHPTLQVVIMSGQASEAELQEARRLGVTDVIEKPWALKYLGQALRTVKGGRGAPRTAR
jgi:DNA-binding response OmpR family regulator